jgi:TolB-like protein/DNA-binding winged helix-turn-helix (wHTH) protein
MSNSRFRFGSFELDGSSSELRKNGLRLHIEDQPFRVLEALVTRAGEVVTREELREAIWSTDTHVDFDRSLTRAVNKVRLALGDSASNPRFLETLPRRGYRFVAPVSRIQEPAEAIERTPESSDPPVTSDLPITADRQSNVRAGHTRWWALSAAVLATAAVIWVTTRPTPKQRISSLAVLPLENISGNPDQSYVSEGITDQLIASLSRLSSHRVVSFKTVMRYKDSRKKLTEIANELDVDAIVTGSAGQIQGQLQVQVRLTRLPGENEVWSERYSRIQSEVQALQNELARNIAEQIGGRLRSEDEPRPTQAFDSELHDHYVRGRLFASEPGREALDGESIF